MGVQMCLKAALLWRLVGAAVIFQDEYLQCQPR
jgi:hypothetical protein